MECTSHSELLALEEGWWVAGAGQGESGGGLWVAGAGQGGREKVEEGCGWQGGRERVFVGFLLGRWPGSGTAGGQGGTAAGVCLVSLCQAPEDESGAMASGANVLLQCEGVLNTEA